ncbi:hypothetical protein GCM10008933_12000 [Paenibacillus motobuensis]|uniref:Uncharacterized protein n=2 Tax=Paenibacillus motobuensis TaxID=295324 RepID=A0ABN0Y410_9BACL
MLPAIKAQEQISSVISPALNQINLVQDSLLPLIETINKIQEDQLRAAKKAIKLAHLNLETLSPTLEALTKATNHLTKVPDAVIPKIDELFDSFEPILEAEEIEKQNQNINITINYNTTTTSEKWTWDRILYLVLAVLQFIYPFYSEYKDSVEKKEEKEIRIQQHNEIIEKFNELIYTIQPLISEHNSEEDAPDLDNPER